VEFQEKSIILGKNRPAKNKTYLKLINSLVFQLLSFNYQNPLEYLDALVVCVSLSLLYFLLKKARVFIFIVICLVSCTYYLMLCEQSFEFWL
jgi:hypothetical protein